MERNAHPSTDNSADGLCYLSAGLVERPGGTLADLELCNREHESVGTVDGVLIDPPVRRVKFFVVKVGPINGRFLVPVEDVVRVEAEAEDGVPRLEAVTEGMRLARFNPVGVRAFSEDDAITAMLASRAA